jgi:hypothetical protein
MHKFTAARSHLECALLVPQKMIFREFIFRLGHRGDEINQNLHYEQKGIKRFFGGPQNLAGLVFRGIDFFALNFCRTKISSRVAHTGSNYRTLPLPNMYIYSSKKITPSVLVLPAVLYVFAPTDCFYVKRFIVFIATRLFAEDKLYLEKCFIKAGEASVRGADGVQELNGLVEIVECPNRFVQGAHHLGGVFGQLEGALLLLFGFQFGQIREQIQQLFVFLEQPERVARAKSITTIRRRTDGGKCRRQYV